jgi:hypothetical protein
MRRIAILLALAAAAGCDGLATGGEPAAAYVRVVDTDGDPLRPDQVAWYYAPDGGPVEEHPARCANQLCTVWAIPAEVTGQAYVVATRTRPHPDPYCGYYASDAGPIVASVQDPPTITLELDPDLVMCE